MLFFPFEPVKEVECKFVIAARTLCLRVSSDIYSRECNGTLGIGLLERNICLLYTHYCETSKSLEGDCGMDRVPRCHLLTPFQEGSHLTANPYIVCIFVFTALIHCTLCSDCSHIFVSFQTVVVVL